MIWNTFLNIIVSFADFLLSYFPNVDYRFSAMISQAIGYIQSMYDALCYFIRLDTLALIINMIIALELLYIGVLGLWLILRQTKLVAK